jgi:uncharacterized membrane protein YecN with MAPEG domain
MPTVIALPVTLLYAGLLSLVFLVLSARVVLMRGEGGVSLGDGGHPVLLRRIRAHANFAEYVPLLLLMLGFLEVSGLPKAWLHGLGATLLLARLLHGYALSFTASSKFGRMIGAALTFLLLLVAGLLCVWRAFFF